MLILFKLSESETNGKILRKFLEHEVPLSSQSSEYFRLDVYPYLISISRSFLNARDRKMTTTSSKFRLDYIFISRSQPLRIIWIIQFDPYHEIQEITKLSSAILGAKYSDMRFWACCLMFSKFVRERKVLLQPQLWTAKWIRVFFRGGGKRRVRKRCESIRFCYPAQI